MQRLNRRVPLALVALAALAGCDDPGARYQARQKAKRDALEKTFKPVIARLQGFDLKTAKKDETRTDTDRPALMVTSDLKLSGRMLHMKDESGKVIAKTAGDVGLLVIPVLKRGKDPYYEYEGGGKGFATTVYAFAVLWPEKIVVGMKTGTFLPPKSTIGTTTTIAGSSVTSSVNQYGQVPPDFYWGFLKSLRKRAIFGKMSKAFEPVIAGLKGFDLRKAEVLKGFAETRRRVLILTPKLTPSNRMLEFRDPKREILAGEAKDVGLLLIPNYRRSKEPTVTYKDGTKGYSATAILFAVSWPEKAVVAAHKKVFAPPKTATGKDQVASVPTAYFEAYIKGLRKQDKIGLKAGAGDDGKPDSQDEGKGPGEGPPAPEAPAANKK